MDAECTMVHSNFALHKFSALLKILNVFGKFQSLVRNADAQVGAPLALV